MGARQTWAAAAFVFVDANDGEFDGGDEQAISAWDDILFLPPSTLSSEVAGKSRVLQDNWNLSIPTETAYLLGSV